MHESAYTNTQSIKQDMSVSIVPRLWAGPKNQSSLFIQTKFLFSTAPTLLLAPLSPIHWLQSFHPQEWTSWSMKMIIHLHPEPELRMCRAIPALPYAFMTLCLSKQTDLPSTKTLNDNTVLPNSKLIHFFPVCRPDSFISIHTLKQATTNC